MKGFPENSPTGFNPLNNANSINVNSKTNDFKFVGEGNENNKFVQLPNGRKIRVSRPLGIGLMEERLGMIAFMMTDPVGI